MLEVLILFFLGMSFAGGIYSLDASPIKSNIGTNILVQNLETDKLYITSKTNMDVFGEYEWDANTILFAQFNNTLLAGNISFYVNEISYLRIKRRVKGTLEWSILYEKKIRSAKDLSLSWNDITAKSGVTYEYAIVPVFDKVEGSFYINEITSDFCGLFILDMDNVFATQLDVSISEKRSKPRIVINTINRKYPFVISNGKNDYDSGSVSAQFLEYNPTDDSWDIDGSYNYVKNFKDFVNNGRAKILKYEDGRAWLIEISSSDVVDTEDDKHLQIHTSFDWTEIGDIDNTDDLYNNGLIEIEGLS